LQKEAHVPLETFIRAMPKVELHVHLEGAIQPETLLTLARRNRVQLPADTVPGLRTWYTFTSFDHFVEIYLTISNCIRTPDDIELITREFLAGQAAQNIRYTEATYTAWTHYQRRGIPFEDQLAAINRARVWAEAELGVTMGLIIDIPRGIATAEHSLTVAEWAISAMGRGVVALGLGGPEQGYPPEDFRAAFEHARAAGLPAVPHAGETAGAASVRGALHALHAIRIGHGVRCLEDPSLVIELRKRQIPLEVCPTSNVCLGIAPELAEHPLPRLLDAGLFVTINSDDPPMFNTTLSDEYLGIARAFHLGAADIEQLVLNAVRASLLPSNERARMEAQFLVEIARLHGREASDT
jgi:adenosine deaminase